MSNRNRGSGESPALRRIFKMRKDGKSHLEIINELERKEAHTKSSRELGKESELNTLRALRNLWYVTDVTQVGVKNEHHDHLSHDLKVVLDSISCLSFLEIGLYIPDNSVFVEVKSSKEGIEIYKLRTIADMDLKNETEFNSLMHTKKTILLNGQQEYAAIQTDFTDSLVLLNLAWANQNT